MTSVAPAAGDSGSAVRVGDAVRYDSENNSGHIGVEQETNAPVDRNDNNADSQIKRKTVWNRLRKKWNRRGLNEVETDHPRYEMLNAIRSGIHNVVTESSGEGPEAHLTESDYGHVLRTSIISGSSLKTYEFTSYASCVFSTLRHAVGISEEAYIQSIADSSSPWLQFISNSRSGQDFFLTNDKRFFLKTEKKKTINNLLQFLKDYLQHFLSYPHSLLVKFVGVYAIRLQGQSVLYFYMMKNICFPGDRIEDIFDIKGCLAGRFQKPQPVNSIEKVILKDKNFDKEVIDLGEQRNWFLKQVDYDVDLLRSWGVQDYSLLLGRQKLQSDEKKKDFADVIFSIKKSVSPTDDPPFCSHKSNTEKSPDHQTMPKDSAGDTGDSQSNQPHQTSTTDIHAANSKPKLIHRRISLIEPHHGKLSDQLKTGNHRLLPQTMNPLHIIDGPDYRYYVGIIDFLTKYQLRQKTVRMWKNIHFCGRDHSTVPPEMYATRLKQFISDHIS